MVFEETQRFRQWWLWMIMIITLSAPIVLVFYAPQPTPFSAYVTAIGVPIVIFYVMMFVLRLETAVDEQGVHYRFFPFHITTRLKTWDNIERAYVRRYYPLREYGGWGIRFSMNGTALNVSGDIGLQIIYKNGKRLLIGTKKKDELHTLMQSLYEKGIVKDKETIANSGDRF